MLHSWRVCKAIDIIKVIYLSEGDINLIFHGKELKNLNIKI